MRNDFYIQQYREEGRALGMDIRLVLVEDICRDGAREEEDFADFVSAAVPPDFVINRTRMYRFGEILEDREIPVFNSSQVSRVGNDKWYAYRFFKQQLPELPMAETRCIASSEELAEILFSAHFAEYRETFPVFKSRHGHGGQEVFLLSGGADAVGGTRSQRAVSDADAVGGTRSQRAISDADAVGGTCSQRAVSDADAVYRALSGKACIAQRRISTRIPADIRVYVLGGKLYAAIKRTGQPGGFLANFSMGGRVQPVSLTASQRDMVEAVLKVLPMDYAGIDFIEDTDGNWYLGEIEDMVGARMLWKCQGVSLVGEYLRHIRESIGGRGLQT